ncbi:hypothetical protein EZS27_013279 [termite gut metagenome]|uniref:Uncharacterized protein n=1 Tax=termite gut metagenome TaxID=433724 RepID=A0A5J4RXQ3_9ZZZZ
MKYNFHVSFMRLPYDDNVGSFLIVIERKKNK